MQWLVLMAIAYFLIAGALLLAFCCAADVPAPSPVSEQAQEEAQEEARR